MKRKDDPKREKLRAERQHTGDTLEVLTNGFGERFSTHMTMNR